MIEYRKTAGSTNVSVTIRILDETDGTPETGVQHDTTGIDLKYRREGATTADITEAALTALDDAHSDGGIEHIGAGYYRLDLPDAACAAGAAGVLVFGTVTGMVVIGCYVHLEPIPADAVEIGGTAQTGGDVMASLGEENAAAADGDPSAAESLMQYVKQLVNMLGGSAGIANWPAAADPGNGVSIAEALRRIFDDSDEMQSKLPAGTIASSAEATAIQNNTRVRVMIPTVLERPDSGTESFTLDLYIYDEAGSMEVPDSAPTITAKNQAGTDRSGNLGAVANPATGHYTVTYDVASGHAIEQIRFEWTITEGTVARLHGGAVQVVDTTAVDFTAADRAKLDTLHDTRIPDVISLANINGQVDTALGDYDGPTKAEMDAGFAALNDLSFADIWTGQLTESYAAKGVAPTPAQALFATQQGVLDYEVTGTVLTVRQIDGVSAAMTFTLDDAADPTDRTRAT